MSEFEFTYHWFASTARPIWEQLLPQIGPTKILEVGSYEGASACYLIDKLGRDADIELHCVDTWSGGIEHQTGGGADSDMNAVEARFERNIQRAVAAVPRKVEVTRHTGPSDFERSRLLSENKRNYFDFVYIDGSHQAPDVLCDAVPGFTLLRVGGLMAFDDYLWAEQLPYGKDPLRCPKPAIDAFINLNIR